LFSGITFLPFVYHQYTAYQTFCINSSAPAPWCARNPPTIYTYVQSTYWNVGFLRYWTISQLPNFLLAAPILLLLMYFTIRQIYKAGRLIMSSTKPPPTLPFLSPSITPHAIHALFLTTTLLFGSHTQIALRLAGSMPFTYWAAAWLLIERPVWGKWWVGWSVVWGFVSIVLWSTFLPPA
jgi:phosphatidylinositol glycan class V